MILYMFDKREIGLLFLMEEQLPFFGIRRMQAPRKLLVSSPVLKQWIAYFKRGRLRSGQHFFITLLLKPSRPGADLRLQLLIDLSNSSSVRGALSLTDSPSVIFELQTFCEEQMSSPRKSSTILSLARSSLGGAL